MVPQCLELHSRDHFCIACDKGEFYLLVLTANPIWRDRDGESPMQLSRDDLVRLMPGDRIVLGMGGGAVSSEGCDENTIARSGIFWRFHLDQDEGQQPISLSTGGAGQ